MEKESKFLDIATIRQLIREEKIQWSGHILLRMHQRGIKIKDVITSIMSGEIIEYYEEDYPFPSCLILGFIEENKGLHTVCALGQGYVWMITAYYPSLDEWCEDLKTRRK